MARTNISVDQGVFQQFSAEAAKQNKTLFAFANESLSVASRVSSEGGSPSELYNMWKSTTLLKQIDVVILPSDVMDDLIFDLYSADKAKTLKIFSDLGNRLVPVLKIAAADITELSKLAKEFGGLLPIKQLSLKVQAAKGDIEIDVIGAGRKIESTECAREFLVSIVHGYGYSVVRQDVNVGIIRMWVTPKNSH